MIRIPIDASSVSPCRLSIDASSVSPCRLSADADAGRSIAIDSVREGASGDDCKLVSSSEGATVAIGVPDVAGGVFGEGGVSDGEGRGGSGDAQVAVLGGGGADGIGRPGGSAGPHREDVSDGAVGEPDGRRTRALGEEDIPCGTRLATRHEGALYPEVARYMQALRGRDCADTDVLTQPKGQQQSHQKVLAYLHKRCVLAYDKYTPNFTKLNGARRSERDWLGWARGGRPAA